MFADIRDGQRPLIDPDDAAILTQQGTLLASIEPGRQRIHRMLFTSTNGQELSHLAVSPPGTILSSDSFETIPDYLVSQRTLEYIGFTPATSTKIWASWNTYLSHEVFEIGDGIKVFEKRFRDHIKPHHPGWDWQDTVSETDSAWVDTMNRTGIDSHLQNLILTPCFKKFRLTQTCIFWVLDTLSAKYASLKDIHEASRERGFVLRRAAGRYGPIGQYIPTPQPPKPIDSIFSISQAAEDTDNFEGTLKLYYAGHTRDIQRILNADGTLLEDRLTRALATRTAGDFDSEGERTCIYMYGAADLEIAQSYVAYAKKRISGFGNAGSILAIEMPKSAMEALDESQRVEVHWPSAEYTALVWTCRHGLYLSRSKSLKRFRNVKVIVGSVLESLGAVFNAVSEENAAPEGLEIGKVMENERGEAVVQYAFMGGGDGMEFLAEHARNARMYACTTEDLGRVESELSRDRGVVGVVLEGLEAFSITGNTPSN